MVPFIDAEHSEKLLQGQLFGFFDIVSGGAFKQFSIFAMSITPYINATIIMQLLTVVIPKLEELNKEGEEGRKKIAEYTRYGTVVLASSRPSECRLPWESRCGSRSRSGPNYSSSPYP